MCVAVSTCVVVQMLYWLQCSPRLWSSLLSQQYHSPVGSNIHQTHRATSDLQAPRTDPTGWTHTHSNILTNRTWAPDDTNCCYLTSYEELPGTFIHSLQWLHTKRQTSNCWTELKTYSKLFLSLCSSSSATGLVYVPTTFSPALHSPLNRPSRQSPLARVKTPWRRRRRMEGM